MAIGERARRLSLVRGKDYYKKRGFRNKTRMRIAGISMKAGTNKLTKRYTNKSERMQVRQYIHRMLTGKIDE